MMSLTFEEAQTIIRIVILITVVYFYACALHTPHNHRTPTYDKLASFVLSHRLKHRRTVGSKSSRSCNLHCGQFSIDDYAITHSAHCTGTYNNNISCHVFRLFLSITFLAQLCFTSSAPTEWNFANVRPISSLTNFHGFRWLPIPRQLDQKYYKTPKCVWIP